tara:strand:+ start:499 stop:693 length:195 start_codon:yes stop_codon:yes gene_type:complete
MKHISEDKVNSMLFDIEWELINKTEELIKSVCDDHETKKEIEALLEKRYNLIGAAMVFDYEELK